MATESSNNTALGQQFLRTAWLFQGGCSLPVLLLLGGSAFSQLLYPYVSYYRFFTYTVNAIFAGGIIFIVLFQRKLATSNELQTALFEASKSFLGTVMWVWLMLDSAFYKSGYYYTSPSRLTRAALAFIILPILFYPTALCAILLQRKKNELPEPEESSEVDDASDERTPLMPS